MSLAVKIGNFFFRWRDTIFSLVIFFGIFLIIHNENKIITGWIGDFNLDIYFSILGLIFVFFGITIRFITIGFIYIKKAGLQKKIHADKLFRDGLFAHTRNPLYVGNILILIGSVVTINLNIFWFIVMPIFFFIYYSIIKAEENFLLNKFGNEYKRYLQEVPRFFPSNFHKFPESFQNLNFSLKRVIKAEHPTQSIIIIILMIINILKFYYRYQVPFSNQFIKIGLGIIIMVMPYYIIANILTRKGKLD